MESWNDKDFIEGKTQIRRSVLKHENRKRLTGIGVLSVKPSPDYTSTPRWPSTEKPQVHTVRDVARIDVTKEFAQTWDGSHLDGRGSLMKECKETLHPILMAMKSTAYDCKLFFKGREIAVLYPHTAHENGACNCAR